MSTQSETEYIVLVDDSNQILGTAPKIASHNDATPLHRAFSVFLFNEHGDLLLQQRAVHKKTWPGVWSNSCCGHLMLEESPEQAAARRLEYELGLSRIQLHMVLPEYRYRFEKDGVVENEICPVMVGFCDQEPAINPEEVASIRWVGWRRFLDNIKKEDSFYTPWAVEEARLLEQSTLFQELYQPHH